MRIAKIFTISIAILFTAQACNVLFGDLGGGGSGSRGVFISFDSGSTWGEANVSGEAAAIQSGVVSEIFLEAGNPDNLLLPTTNRGLFASDNGGKSWGMLLPNVAVTSAFINPQNKQEIYAAGSNGNGIGTVWKSSDRGALWVEIFNDSSGKAAVTALSFDSLQPTTFYAALSSGTVIKSQDSGETWSVLTEVKGRPQKLVVAPDGPRSVYLLTNNELVFSKDKGSSWESANLTEKPSQFNDLFVENNRPANVYLGTEKGLFRSRNSGASWSKVELPANQESTSVSAVAVNPDNSSQIFATIRWTIYRSDDNGSTWKTISLPTRRVVGEIVVDTFEPNRIYAGMK